LNSPKRKSKSAVPRMYTAASVPTTFYELVEQFYILLLDRNHQVLKIHKISSAGTNSTLADPKLIFKKALDHLASGIILIHNHPSGKSNRTKR